MFSSKFFGVANSWHCQLRGNACKIISVFLNKPVISKGLVLYEGNINMMKFVVVLMVGGFIQLSPIISV